MSVTRLQLPGLILLVGLAGGIGCSTRVLDWDARLGERTDHKSGYYSYKSGLPARAVEEVCVSLASRATLEGRQVLRSGDEHSFYPAVAYEPPKTYVDPASLRWAIPACSRELASSPDTLEVGYFVKNVSDGRWQIADETESTKTKGLSWCRLRDRGRELIEGVLPVIRERAAAEGADAVLDLAVYYIQGPHPYGVAGVYVTGRAVAFGEILEAPAEEPGESNQPPHLSGPKSGA
jgi:hypothetical protein